VTPRPPNEPAGTPKTHRKDESQAALSVVERAIDGRLAGKWKR
jgi:hypothetical protein